MFKTTTGVEYRVKKVESSTFYANKQIDELILDTEVLDFIITSPLSLTFGKNV